ncbi:MAG: hypothetical protein JST68_14055, partial [Bacteroidetes bacterium]|nr:hypothetical protein [Bacteroidota bacterium]
MIEDAYPLSPLQEGFYYHWLRFPASGAYFDQVCFRIRGSLDVTTVEESYRQLVARHGILRTFFTGQIGGQPLQVVRKEVVADFRYLDERETSTLPPGVLRSKDRLHGFDLHKGPLMRLTVATFPEEEYEFIWSHHHILMDGWCMSILMKDFFAIYYSLLKKEPVRLKPVRAYSEYIKWITRRDQRASLTYWREYLSGYEPSSSIFEVLGKNGQPCRTGAQ